MNAILESLNAFSAAGLTAVLNTLWLALAVAAAMWFALRLMPRVNAATRHAVWWAVLGLVMLMPVAALCFRHAPVAPSAARIPGPMAKVATPISAVKRHPVAGVGAEAPPVISVPVHAAHTRAAAAPLVRIPVEFHPGNWTSSLLLLWMAASLVLLGRIVLSYFHLRGLRRRARTASADLVLRFEQRLRDSGTSRAPQLLVSDEVISPMAAGFLHPVVILPEVLLGEIGKKELDYVLLHELAHVARGDDWTNLMDRLASAVFVLHPVAAWVLHRIKREREIACDDWVVAATGCAADYAVTLAHLFEFCSARRRELLATAMAHRTSNISERIEMLVRPRRHFSAGASLPRVGFCVAAGVALLSLGVRVPGWIAFAQDSTVAAQNHHTVLQPENSTSRVAAAAPQLVAEVSPALAQPGAASAATPGDDDKTWRHEWKLTREGSSSSQVQLSLMNRGDNGSNWMNTEGVALSSLNGFSLSALDHDGPVKFEYVRKAGRILCEGTVAGGQASGPFTVVVDPSFVAALEKMGYSAPHDDEAFSLVLSDVTLSYAQAVRDTGLTSSIGDLVELENHGVGADYVRAVRQEGFTDYSAEQISRLRDHGVDPKYLKAIKAAAPGLSIEEIDSLYDHGVKPDYYKSMKAAAPQLGIEQIDSLYDHGVKADSYSGFASLSPKLSIEEINSLCDHGVNPEYYRSVRSADPSLGIEQIDSLYDHGVKPEYYQSVRSADPNLSIEQIDSLYDHGVKAEAYTGFASVDRKLSIEEINSLYDHGVGPEFYQGTKAADATVSIEEIDNLRDHGVDPEYLKEIRALPDGFSIADISELRDHGITAKYIRNLHDMGMKKLTADQIVRLRDGE